MKHLRQNFSWAATLAGTALTIWLAATYTNPLWWLCFSLLLVAIALFASWQAFRKRIFWRQRKDAMEAVERLISNLAYYDRELPLNRYSRFQFQTALDHGYQLSEWLKGWIELTQRYFENHGLAKSGLKLSDVPALVDSVLVEVGQAYKFIHEGSKGPKPKILELDWFDEETLKNTDFSQRRSAPAKDGVRLSLIKTCPDPITAAATVQVVDAASAKPDSDRAVTPSQSDVASRKADTALPGVQPTEQRLLTYAGGETDKLTTAANFQARGREKYGVRVRDVIRPTVVFVDFQTGRRAS